MNNKESDGNLSKSENSEWVINIRGKKEPRAETMKKVEVRCIEKDGQKILEIDLEPSDEDATVIYACSVKFSDEQSQKLEKQLGERPGYPIEI